MLIHRTLEIHNPQDLDDALKLELHPSASASTTGTASSASANLSYVKPSRPGRGGRKTTVKKFIPDADGTV